MSILKSLAWLAWFAGMGAGPVFAQSAFRQEGLQVANPTWFVIQNATLHLDGQTQMDGSSLLIHADRIVAIGSDLQVPDGAQIIDATGRHVYPGLIDGYLAYDGSLPSVGQSAASWNPRITPQLDLASAFTLDALDVSDRRAAGFTNVLVAPASGILRGTSFVTHLEKSQSNRTVLKRPVALQARLTINPSFGDPAAAVQTAPGYPSSPMGAYALARQTFYDAQWYREAWRLARVNPELTRPEWNEALEALQPVLAGELPLMVETSNELFCLRARRFANEFGVRLILLGSGNEYRRLGEVVAVKAPLVVPLDFPKAPKVANPSDAVDVALETLMHWDLAPENPVRLISAGASVALTTHGLSRPDEWRAATRRAIERGLPPAAALNAWTSVPAQIFGIEDQVGTLAAGKIANLLICDAPLFDEKSKILETWVLGQRWEHKPEPMRQFSGVWQLKPDLETQPTRYLSLNEDPKLTATLRNSREPNPDAPGVELKSPGIQLTKLSGRFSEGPEGNTGVSLLELIIDREGEGVGSIVHADGRREPFTASRVGDPEPKPKKESKGHPLKPSAGEANDAPPSEVEAETAPAESSQETKAAGVDEAESSESDREKQAAPPDPAALFNVNYPLGDSGRETSPTAPGRVLIKNATIWTCGPLGRLQNAALVIEANRIAAILPEGSALPAAEVVIDAAGRHLTPGIIDCHSHMASDSGINEGSQSVTAEVRIGDFVDCDDPNIIRQLAGGVTCVNVLHGSANPIGGQNQVLKLRWSRNDEEMKFVEAPPGIKFALGENVKRSNSQTPSTRYPRTRMGVEQLMHDSFRAAREYDTARKTWEHSHQGLPPRVDLELEALAEIVRGERWIHCHSYRQDEILALIRVLDSHGIQIGTFQHILEGYKVADEMAQHGAMASAFSDWWAYKFEVYDAIPQAGALMHQQGLVVSFNSDDAELARHLNHEAAKAVRYGGVDEVEALKFVTLNPAKQLRIDRWVGSLEVGKHADLALWSGHPLATTSVCEQTWVDGLKYFDRVEAAELSARQAEMKRQLIQKVLASKQPGGESGEEKIDPAQLWPRYDEFCHGHQHDDDDGGDGNSTDHHHHHDDE